VSEFLLIAGMSGAGRSSAAAMLEDLGWEVIDNLPPRLIPLVGEPAEHVALVVGRGAQEDSLDVLDTAMDALRSTGSSVRLVFLDANDEVLVRRFEGTRRRHPVETGNLLNSITRERALLERVKAQADVMIDTSTLNVHGLRERLAQLFSTEDPRQRLETSVISFGYAQGIPLDVDLLFDCRFLPNPHWVEDLRPFTGLDTSVRDYVLGQPEAVAFLDKLDDMLGLLLPAYVKEGKSYLTIAVGCTGGRHRSVALAEEIGRLIRAREHDPLVIHRDIREPSRDPAESPAPNTSVRER
jgi:UPF0042 nucleotide-binding protein